MKIALTCLLLIAQIPFVANAADTNEGFLFLGTPYERANGHIAQSSTSFQVLRIQEKGAIGEIAHREEMNSFDLVFSLSCDNYQLDTHADVNVGFLPQYAVSLRAFPEWLEVQFPDGERASAGADVSLPSSEEIASARFLDYLNAGEKQSPLSAMIDGHTNAIVSRNSHRLRFIVEGIAARVCTK